MQTNVYVLFHRNCLDGSGACYAAWKFFRNKREYIVNYIPVQYNEPVPQELFDPNNINTEVYVLDFSYPQNVLEDIANKVTKLVVLDHHKTAMQDLKDLPYAKFDMTKCGAVMAWEYFFPDSYVPQLLLHVQDRDLWQWRLPDTDAITVAFDPRRHDMHAWDYYCDPELAIENTNSNLRHLKEIGQNIVQYRDNIVNRQAKNAKIINYKGYRVGITNASTLVSEIGHAIYSDENSKLDFSITFFLLNGNEAILSFRSADDGIDVSQFARELGQGGGHEHAAGVKVSVQTLCNILNETHQ